MTHKLKVHQYVFEGGDFNGAIHFIQKWSYSYDMNVFLIKWRIRHLVISQVADLLRAF